MFITLESITLNVDEIVALYRFLPLRHACGWFNSLHDSTSCIHIWVISACGLGTCGPGVIVWIRSFQSVEQVAWVYDVENVHAMGRAAAFSMSVPRVQRPGAGPGVSLPAPGLRPQGPLEGNMP